MLRRACYVLPIFVLTLGCSRQPMDTPAINSVPTLSPSLTEDHGHKPSQHGGIIVSIGADSYHAEAVFEKGGTLRLYLLQKDETRILEIDAQELTAYVKAQGDAEAEPVPLKPDPTPEDTPGKTSRYVAQLPPALAGKNLDVTIPSIRIEGERFRLSFQSNPVPEGHEGMPLGVTGEDEQKLYLTPGGIYTAEDVKANGGVTASQKFKGVRANHDLRPKQGDLLCPITMTKANEKFPWIIGGKTYTFCCPPCIDEFVQMAKETPEEIREPEFYRKR